VIVAAGVPKSRTEVKTNVSGTEIVADRDGTLIVKKPLSSVNPARINQPALGGA